MYKTESSPSLFSPPIIIPFLVELFDSKLRDSKHDFSPEKKSSLRREKTGRKIYIYIYIKWTREGKGGRDERIIWRAHGPDGSMAAFEMGEEEGEEEGESGNRPIDVAVEHYVFPGRM